MMKANLSPYHRARAASQPMSRREFLWRSGGGLGGIALASMLFRDEALAQPLNSGGVLTGKLHYPAKPGRVGQLFRGGAPSHVNTFDYKPLLIQKHGEKWTV